jgi:hypothetical protein
VELKRRLVIHSSVRKGAYIAAMLFLVFGLASSAWAQFPWQVNDAVLCSGGGNCSVVRITTMPSTQVQLLNQLSDGLTNAGTTAAAGTNNTLHLLVTDAGATNPHSLNVGSNIVKYSIASVDPATGNTIPHTVLNVFDGSNGGADLSIQGLAISSAGHMFAGNNGEPVHDRRDQPGSTSVAAELRVRSGLHDRRPQTARSEGDDGGHLGHDAANIR